MSKSVEAKINIQTAATSFGLLQLSMIRCICFFLTLHLHTFHLYNEATRKSHHYRMLAARAAFVPLFYIRRHPIYQKLHLQDLIYTVSYPAELRQYMEQFPSFSVTGLSNHGGGGGQTLSKRSRMRF